MEASDEDGRWSAWERHSLLPPSLGARGSVDFAGFRSIREPMDPKFDILKTQIKTRFNVFTRCASGFCCCCPKNTVNVIRKEEPLFSFDDCFGHQPLNE